MKREITAHRVGILNKRLKIVADVESVDGAPTQYTITSGGRGATRINFHSGPLAVEGDELAKGCQITGISNEALLAIVEDRLSCFQRGKFPCEQNGYALALVGLTLQILRDRTVSRAMQGTEGKHVK